MDIMTALSATSKAIDFAKLLNSVEREFNAAEMKAKAADLLSNLADVKIALVEAKDDLANKSAEIKTLKDAFQIRTKCVRQNEFLYEVDEKGEPIGRPFCPRCEQVDGRLIKLISVRHAPLINSLCPQCKTEFIHAQQFQSTRLNQENR